MGFLCESLTRGRLNADQIVENINKFFQGMLIRQIGIDEIKEKIKSRVFSSQVTDIEGWKKFLNDEIYNSEYGQTSRALVGEAMQDAKTNYNDQTLPILSLLFLSNSNKDTFINAFKAVNLAKKGQSAGSNIASVVKAGKQGGILGGLTAGLGAIKNVQGAVHQAANPSLIKREELKTMMSYHMNFLTLLPVNILAKHNEGIPMKGYFIKVLNNAFNKNVQNRYVEETLFANYNNQEEINVEQFFGDHYLTLTNDNGLRKGLVTNYITNLSPTEVIKIISGD
jgi:hypothetical protein